MAGADPRARLSLCMIVRDEEVMLLQCLASVEGVVDEIVVVDTGSQDDTVAIAEASGATVAHLPWCDDFSAPRNRALELASGAWVLILDADERLAPHAGAVLRAAIEADDFDCGLLPLHNASSVDADPHRVLSGQERIAEVAHLPRLLRRTDDLRYTGIVHENVGEWLHRGRRAKFLRGVDVIHLGGIPSLREQRDKSARNIRLLERAVALGERAEVTPFGYLAHEYHEAGDVTSARRVSAEGWRLVEQGVAATDLAILRLATAHAWLQLTAGETQDTIAVCERALAEMPRHPDLYFLRGCAHEASALRAGDRDMRRGRLSQAADDYGRALDRDGHAVLQQFVDGATGWAATTRLATVWLLQGKTQPALAKFSEVPDRTEAIWGKAECQLRVGLEKEAWALLQPTLDERPDGWVLAALTAEALGMTEQMMAMVAKSQQTLPRGFCAPHRRERYADALALASIYHHTPTALPGPIGQLSGILAGRFEETPGARLRDPDEGAVARALKHMLDHTPSSRAHLTDPRAVVLCPWLSEVLA